jgi:hypothetical protein
MWSDASHYNSPLFNSLPPIETADKEMRAKNRLNKALSVFGPVFAKHKMSGSWGISLLHRHWRIGNDELPIQDSPKIPGPREFITSPRHPNFPKSFSPAILAVEGKEGPSLTPLEFSTDKRAHAAVQVLARNQEFVQEFCDAARENDLATTFGLIALKDVSSPELELVEFTHTERVSILREVPSTETDGKTFIQTCWRFKADANGIDCEASCFARCTVSDDGGHSGDHAPAHAPG